MKESPVHVLLIGAGGRMGKTVLELSRNDPEVEIAGQCDLGDAIDASMKNCHVAIDFSHANAIDGICGASLHYRKPLVIGTTGHSQEQRTIIEEAAHSIPIVFASNFSVGVNALFWLTGKAAELLGPDFNAEIVETHHKTKKDAPSGTAKMLGEILKTADKTHREILIRSIREGEVVGEHTVFFNGPGEQLELTHRAASREIFARGALRAAKWITQKPPALYSMQDVLGL
jgi:4-hydroxy-tetrahydrodipicolinate reductase